MSDKGNSWDIQLRDITVITDTTDTTVMVGLAIDGEEATITTIR
jgi:hypothetical protein